MDEPRRGILERTAQAVSFERIVILGLLGVLFTSILLSFIMATFYEDGKAVDFVLAVYKDITLMTVGALVGNLRHKPQTGGDDNGK